MKRIKLLVLLLTVAVAGFYACTDNNPVENEIVTSKSISLRTTLNELKKVNGLGKTTANDQFLCFQFVYPLSLSYNDGTTITVSSYQGLLEVLTNETSNLYIDGIAFPFQVQEENTITTINNEAEFYLLIESCTFQTVNDCVFDFTCYDIVYPISIINANSQTQIIENQTELMQLVANPDGSNTYELNIVFPISVIQNNQTIVINDLYAFYDLNNDCGGSTCICTADYNPVCVQTPTGIVEFSNACFAQCAGFSQNDFVPCNSTPSCNLSDLSVAVGSCNSDGSYSFTINFAYSNASNSQFEVRLGNTFIGTYSLTQLPLTINYSGPNDPVNYLSVNIVDNGNCAAYAQFTPPNCGSSTTINFGASLGSCFTVAYPVQVQYQNNLVTINSDGDLLQYYFPAQSNIPALIYPVTVTFASAVNPVTMVISNQAAFEAAIASHCN